MKKTNPTGTGPTSSATSKQSKATEKAPSGIYHPASSLPTLQLNVQDPTSDSTLTPKNHYSTRMNWAGTGTKAGISPTSPSD